jgi:branched-chain amino acid transport system ATP-binding protein
VTATVETTDDNALLEVRDLRVSYGSTRALFGVSFRVHQGRVLAILGANGAGKSTVARAVCGLVPADSGSIRYQGRAINGWPAYRIARAGLLYIPEGRGVFRQLTVRENLRLATKTIPSRADRNAAIDKVVEFFPVLRNRANQMAGTLSGGEQQMLALARAFATESQLIIADELSLGLAPRLVEQCFDALEHAKASGVTMIVIEQVVERALELADDCLIMDRGRLGWEGAANTAGVEVRDQYLGRAVEVAGE